MKYVKPYYVAIGGSGRISPPRGATAFHVAFDHERSCVRVSMAIDDEQQTEHRDVWILEDDQPFEPVGPLSYVGSLFVDNRWYHVLITQPARRQPSPMPLSSLPPEMQEQIRRTCEKNPPGNYAAECTVKK